MPVKLVNIDRKTPMLLPPAIQDWVAEDDPVHLVLEAVEAIEAHSCQLNWRGSGSAQYPPRMMSALLIYCYSVGIFSSRKIEQATYNHVAVRYITGDHHPDHDTIAAFRRENGPLFEEAFVKVLELARALKLKQVGVVAIDGSKILAQSSRRRVRSLEQLQAERAELEGVVEALSQRAEQIDRAEQESLPQDRLPGPLKDALKRRESIEQALREIQQRARERSQGRQKEREDFDRDGPGEPPRPLSPEPQPQSTITCGEADARLLPQKKGGYAPSYNVQLAVVADPAVPLILSAEVNGEANDRRQLLPMATKALLAAPQTHRILVDSGYDNSAQIHTLEREHSVIVYCPPEERKTDAAASRQSQSRQRTSDFREGMRACMSSGFGRGSQRLRATSVEPVFGWIKHTLGFDRFNLRGITKTRIEWNLVCLGFNLRLLNRHRATRKSLTLAAA